MNTYAFMFLALFTSCLAQAADHDGCGGCCNCNSYPWEPEPPCYERCSAKLLANTDAKMLVSVLGLRPELAQKIEFFALTGTEITESVIIEGGQDAQASDGAYSHEHELQLESIEMGGDKPSALSEYEMFLSPADFEMLTTRLRSLTQKDFQLLQKGMREEQ